MPNPTRQEIIDAHNALDLLYKRAAEVAPNSALKTYVLEALPPRPQPTMAEVVWDDDKHYLAEAEHPAQGRVIMLFQSPNTGNIFFMYPNGGVQHVVYCRPCNLTPTGKRYALTEVQE